MFRINHATMHLPGTVFPILHKVISHGRDTATTGTGIDINLDIFPVSSVRPVVINEQFFDYFDLLVHRQWSFLARFCIDKGNTPHIPQLQSNFFVLNKLKNRKDTSIEVASGVICKDEFTLTSIVAHNRRINKRVPDHCLHTDNTVLSAAF